MNMEDTVTEQPTTAGRTTCPALLRSCSGCSGLDTCAPRHNPRLVHRDFGPRNVLWSEGSHHRGRLGRELPGAAVARRRPVLHQPRARARRSARRPLRRRLHRADQTSSAAERRRHRHGGLCATTQPRGPVHRHPASERVASRRSRCPQHQRLACEAGQGFGVTHERRGVASLSGVGTQVASLG